jgi:hypothetical protein
MARWSRSATEGATTAAVPASLRCPTKLGGETEGLGEVVAELERHGSVERTTDPDASCHDHPSDRTGKAGTGGRRTNPRGDRARWAQVLGQDRVAGMRLVLEEVVRLEDG